MKEIVSNKMLFYNEKTGQREPVDLLRGESAYEAAVRLGQTTLSEEEWLQEYNANRDAAISAINARQAEATQAVASAGATQVNSIAAKGAETLATIPEDYAKLSSDVTALTEAIEGLKASGSGTSGSAPVVILPEMTLEVVGNGMADIKAMWEVDLVPNKVYIVSFNGTEYTCVANPASAEMELPDGSVVFGGNMPDLGVTNGNSSAPFVAVGWPNSLVGEMGDICGQVIPMDGSQIFTFSIVEASSSGGNAGGGFIVNVTAIEWNADQSGATCTVDKPFSETLAAIEAGKWVTLKADLGFMTVFPTVMYNAEMIVFNLQNGPATMQMIYMADGSVTYSMIQ